MAHLIDKSALIAEIEKRIESCAKQREDMLNVQCYTLADDASARMGELNCLEEFIDTLEVKDVDLEKELIKWHKEHFKKDGTFIRMSGFYLTNHSQMDIAKHFFELGLQARTDKELVEEVYSHIDSIKDTADRMTSGNFMHNRAAIKFSANTIAKVLELMGLKPQKGE